MNYVTNPKVICAVAVPKMIIVVGIAVAVFTLLVYLPSLAYSQIPFLSNVKTKNNNNSRFNNSINLSVDKFGIKEIYPTVKGGREWYVNMNDLRSDPIFSLGSSQSVIKQNSSGGSRSNNDSRDDNGDNSSSNISWRITNPQVRMVVDTPPGSPQWKNVEITGYVKVNNTNVTTAEHYQKDIPNHIAWLARSGVHTDRAPCNGTALSGALEDDGSVGWKKEIWFTGGYTNESAQAKPTNSIVGRWIGWKTVVYNIDNDKAVKMESYLDDKNNNHWVRVTNLTDSGGWYADTSDKRFYSANCGKPKDYIITNSAPRVVFRADNMILDFKDLSVREIELPPSTLSK